MLLTPPLRGADEPAHILRAYGIAQGEVIPSLADAQGRKGLFLPPQLHDEYDFFEAARYRFGSEGFDYRQVMAEYARRQERPIRGRRAIALRCSSSTPGPKATRRSSIFPM